MERATRKRIHRDHYCHHDPYFADGQVAFGQEAAAQGHLRKQGVREDDIFVFFGLFAGECELPHHRIFAYMRIAEIIRVDGRAPPKWASDHPHFLPGPWNANNTVYLGPGRLARHASAKLRLTAPGYAPSFWSIPDWLRETGLTYHRREWRWQTESMLQVVNRGQEFVADVTEHCVAQEWLEEIIAEIEREQLGVNPV